MNIINPYRFKVAPSVDIPLANIISEYKFENNVLDTVGTNNGTAYSLTYADGLVNRTGVFNGSTSYVSVADSNSLSFGNGTTDVPFSISLLFKTNDITKIQYLVSKRLNTVIGEYLIPINATTINLSLITNSYGGGYIRAIFNHSFSNNTWYHIIATYDGDKLNTGINLYVNGVNSVTTRDGTGYTGMVNTTSNVEVGSFAVGKTNFDGNLDCVRIWDKELSQGEITEIATQELAGIDINP